jgi:hypothetical protein
MQRKSRVKRYIQGSSRSIHAHLHTPSSPQEPMHLEPQHLRGLLLPQLPCKACSQNKQAKKSAYIYPEIGKLSQPHSGRNFMEASS